MPKPREYLQPSIQMVSLTHKSKSVCLSTYDEGVPKRHVARVVTSHVELDNDGAREHIIDREAHVLNLGDSDITSVSDSNDGLGVGRVLEVVTVAGDGGPRLADDARANRNLEGRVHTVFAKGEVCNLVGAGRELEDCVENPGLIHRVVAFDGTTAVLVGILDVEEVRDRVVGVVGGWKNRELATWCQSARSRVGRGRGAVDRAAANGVTISEGVHMACCSQDGGSVNLSDVRVGVFAEVVNGERRVGGSDKGDARVDRLAIDQGNPGGTTSVSDSSSARVKGWGNEADGVATVNEHADGVLVEVNALVQGLLMTVVPDTVLSPFDSHISQSKSRTPAQANSGVAIAVAGAGHGNLDVLQLSSLGHPPIECGEWRTAVNSGGVKDDVLETYGKRQLSGYSGTRILAGKQGTSAAQRGRSFQNGRLNRSAGSVTEPGAGQ